MHAEGYADTNVALQTNKNDEFTRERVLDDIELKTIWKALTQGDFGDIVKLLILTAQRREEISGLRWSEVDLKAKAISLPSERTKNGRPHRIPLSQPALTILKARQQNGREYVFGVGEGGFSGWSKSKKRLDETAPLAKPWITHDLLPQRSHRHG